ncbi:MAG: hypothetical protein ACI379_16955 [Nocardioides sp.]|uniref:hypothetical protein n=1 Tax=Nocardioides sp. TaxID=35761 RepID=UPI003EFEC094
MSFEVKPADLTSGGTQVAQLSGTVHLLTNHLAVYAHVNGDSTLFSQFQGEIDSMRETLCNDYTDKAKPIFDKAGGALKEMALDYTNVDKTRAAGFDATMPSDWEYDRPRGMDTWGETAGIDMSEFYSLFPTPSSAFEDWEEWLAIRDGVDYILEFQWLFDVLGVVGLPSPTDAIKENFQGDYDQMGKCLTALDTIGDYWSKARREMAASMKMVDKTWSGNAANATFAWFSEYDDVLSDHNTAVNGVLNRIGGYSKSLRIAFDSLLSLTDALIDLVMSLNKILTKPIEFIQLFLRKGLGEIIGKIMTGIGLFMMFIDVCMMLAGLMGMAFSQLAGHRSINFPDDAKAMDPIDVDGP